MKTYLPLEIVESFAHELKLSVNLLELRRHYKTVDACDPHNTKSIVDQVTEVGRFVDLVLLNHDVPESELINMLDLGIVPALVFIGSVDPVPFLLTGYRQGIVDGYRIENDGRRTPQKFTARELFDALHLPAQPPVPTGNNGKSHTRMLSVLTPLLIEPIVSKFDPTSDGRPLTPVRRLWNLLMSDQKIITHIYVYAIIIGLLSLTLPLGVQAIIGIIAGGTLFQPVILLISFVVLATLGAGFLQLQQMRIVEKLKQRIFARAAFEFAFRIPRIRMEAVNGHYAPELINRFFDVLTIQKGYTKIFTDILTSGLQILFGVILLSFYHEFFVFFAVLLLFLLGMMFYFTGTKGLKTSIYESKYKYKVAQWLEEVGRMMSTFKLAGFTNLSVEKTDYHVSYYLEKRQSHFRILMVQYSGIIIFKVLITAGVLIIGSMLVIDNKISLGQFVASEIVILTVMQAVEKMILSLETVYDVLTAVDKIGNVTDLPLDHAGGVSINDPCNLVGFAIQTRGLTYAYPETNHKVLKDLNLNIAAGERIGIVGPCGAGKTTLVNILSGLFTQYSGSIVYDKYSLREINLTSLRDEIGDNLAGGDIFDGTIEENISVGKADIGVADVLRALELVGLSDFVQSMPKGVHTPLLTGGKQLPSTIVRKIVLARSIAEQPRLLVLDNFFLNLTHTETRRITDYLFRKDQPWTMMCVTHNPVVLSLCDRILMMDNGCVVKEGTFETLWQDEVFRELIPHVPSMLSPR